MSHVLPILGISAFFLIGFMLRSIIQYVRNGQSGLILFKDGNWRGHLRDAVFMLLAGVLFLQSLLFALLPEALSLRRPEGMTVALGGLLSSVALRSCSSRNWAWAPLGASALMKGLGRAS